MVTYHCKLRLNEKAPSNGKSIDIKIYYKSFRRNLLWLIKLKHLQKIQEVGIVAVVRATSIEQAEKITDACIAGGVAAIELTFTVPHADKLIEAMKAKYSSGEIIIGAGTVMDAATARIAYPCRS